MKHRKIIITGGSGYIGQALARYFGKENHVVILSRQSMNGANNNYNKQLVTAKDGYNITYWRWDGKHIEKHWANEIEGADLVINLAGKSVNCRYNHSRRQEIIDSRTHATQVIGEAIRNAVVPPKLWINASSASIYRDSLQHPQDDIDGQISDRKDDNMPYSTLDRLRRAWKKRWIAFRYGKNSAQYQFIDNDFSVHVIKAWENTFFEQRTPFTRKVALRMAVVLGEGGVIVPFFNLLKFGLGGKQGSGRQMFSWVHVEDVCRSIEWCYENSETEGVYNCCAPGPVSNDMLMHSMRKITGHVVGLPAYNWILEMGAALIGTETELVLKSRWVLPTKLMQAGFRFKYEKVEDAIGEIVKNTPRNAYHLF